VQTGPEGVHWTRPDPFRTRLRWEQGALVCVWKWPGCSGLGGGQRGTLAQDGRSPAAGTRPPQAAQGRQDPADSEAAVVDGDPVHGTRALLFEPEAFVERLCALIWKPRVNTVHYHGVFASGSAWRAEVVPDGVRRQKRARLHRAQGTRLDFDERWMPWLSMLSHVFGHDERCPACGAKRWVYDVVLGPWPVRRELLELGIDRSPQEFALARGPPSLW